MKKNDKPIIVEQNFSSSIEEVWEAITSLEKMKLWYFKEITSFKPELGFETKFDVKAGENNFIHLWKVTEVIPCKKISYNWKYENYSGNSFVVFELVRENNSTKLKLTHTVTENFPDDIPEFKRESGLAGWEYFINNRIKEFLKNNP